MSSISVDNHKDSASLLRGAVFLRKMGFERARERMTVLRTVRAEPRLLRRAGRKNLSKHYLQKEKFVV